MMKSADLQRALRSIFNPTELQRRGLVNYSGLDVLKQRLGGIYLMGINPGQDESNPILSEWVPEQSASWSALTDTCWKAHNGQECSHIELKPYQVRVLALARALATPINEIFVTNAIFVATRGEDELTALDTGSLWQKCWTIHQRFLAEMQPAKIVCLGDTPFSLLESKSDQWTSVPQGNGSRWKAADARFPLYAGEVLITRVIRLPHPSWAHANGSAADTFRDYEKSVLGVPQ